MNTNKSRRTFLKSMGTATAAVTLAGSIYGAVAKKKRPNILFAIADDASFPHMGAYGCEWVKTPGFDRVAREGVLFMRAYTPNAKCAPSRACILTGRNSWQLEEAANHVPYFPAKFKTYAETLIENGYHVGYTTKGWAPGDPGKIDGKPRKLLGTAYNARRTNPPATGISASDYAGNFADFLDARADGKPFCFWYGSVEPHRGYEYGSGVAKGAKKLSDIDRVFPFWPDNETVRNDMLDYAFEIEHFDKHLCQMLKKLEEMGELDNTLVIVTADNGMPFPRIKGQEYEYSNHLPLAIMWKDGVEKPGRSVEDFVNFIDFAPTCLELAGIEQKTCGMQPIQGQSLTDILFSEKSGVVNPRRDHVLIGKERHDVGRPNDWGYPIRGIIKDGFLLVRNFEPGRWPAGNPETGYTNCDASPTKTDILNMRRSGEEDSFWKQAFGRRVEYELYHIEKDPDCIHNLADNPKMANVKARLEKQMVDELKEQGDPRMFGNGAIFDNYPYAQPPMKGFYEKFMRGDKIRAGWINQSDIEKMPIK